MQRKVMTGCGAALAFGLAAQAQPQTVDPMTRAESCLREHAAEVARADRSLESAASFLVNYLCAEPVEIASRAQRNGDLLRVLGVAAQGPGAPTVDPATGRLRVTPEPGKSPTDGLGAVNVLQSGFTPAVSASLKAEAARLILDARRRG